MRQLVPPGAPPNPTLRTILSAHKETNKTLKKTHRKHRNTATLLLAELILLRDSKTSCCPPTPKEDLSWPPLRLSICIECTGEEMQRGSGGMQVGAGHWLSSHMGGGEKKVFQRNQQLNLPLPPPILLSLSLSSSPSPSASPSLTGCNDCAAQHGRVWQRLISQTPGTAPLHPGQKQTSLRLLILNWRFCIVSPLSHPGLGNKTINLLTLTRRKRFPYAHK